MDFVKRCQQPDGYWRAFGPEAPWLIGELQHDWPAVFHAKFGAEASPVLARAVVSRCRGGDVLAAREELGRAIGELKTVECHPKLGILRRIELGA